VRFESDRGVRQGRRAAELGEDVIAELETLKVPKLR